MPRSARFVIAFAALLACLGVALGAFGSHALRAQQPEMLSIWQTAVHYHLVHSLGLLFIGVLSMPLRRSRTLRWAAGSMSAGIVLFSGTLYALVLTGERALGMLTPVGGALMILSWALLAAAALRGKT